MVARALFARAIAAFCIHRMRRRARLHKLICGTISARYRLESETAFLNR